MQDFHEVPAIERELAAGDADAYERHLRDDALVIVPGAALEKTACVAAMGESPGWLGFDFADERLIELGEDAVLLTYRFTGERRDEKYSALLSSVYVREPDGWKLILHQQTPLD